MAVCHDVCPPRFIPLCLPTLRRLVDNCHRVRLAAECQPVVPQPLGPQGKQANTLSSLIYYGIRRSNLDCCASPGTACYGTANLRTSFFGSPRADRCSSTLEVKPSCPISSVARSEAFRSARVSCPTRALSCTLRMSHMVQD